MCHSSTPPGTLLHVISFTRPSPKLVLQVTNAGMRRPGYEARFYMQLSQAPDITCMWYHMQLMSRAADVTCSRVKSIWCHTQLCHMHLMSHTADVTCCWRHMHLTSPAPDATCNSHISAELTLLTIPSCGPWQSDSAQLDQTQKRTLLAPSLLPRVEYSPYAIQTNQSLKSVACSEQHYTSKNTGTRLIVPGHQNGFHAKKTCIYTLTL